MYVRGSSVDRRWVASDLYTVGSFPEVPANHHWTRDLGGFLLTACLTCSIIFRQGGVALGYFALFVGPLAFGVYRNREERLIYSRTEHFLALFLSTTLLILGAVCQGIAAVNGVGGVLSILSLPRLCRHFMFLIDNSQHTIQFYFFSRNLKL